MAAEAGLCLLTSVGTAGKRTAATAGAMRAYAIYGDP